MNATIFSNPDMLLIVVAVVVSFALGGAFRLGRTVVRERQAVELTDHELRTLSDRYESQQRKMSRLTEELGDMRQALMQQAMAMGPMHAAFGMNPMAAGAAPAPVASAPAPAAPVATPAAAPQAAARAPAPRPAPARTAARQAAPAAAKPATRKATPMELARAGASADILIARCGLSRAEAELVISVHGKGERAAA